VHIAYILTGGNEGNRSANLEWAKDCIARQCGEIIMASAQYESEPWGMAGQSSFYNQALKVATALEPSQLLHQLLAIEESLGRVRGVRYGPRTIDIDILLFDDRIISEPHLKVPHPQLPYRRFALECLSEIAPLAVEPVLQKTVQQLLAECADPLWVRKLE
jgi:2-amino-4-hydroxy-6-hydroxymethyldihydropteridine diphosphokinase